MAKEMWQELRLWNVADEATVQAGKRRPLVVRAKVDNGSSKCVLPKKVADELNLVPGGTIWVRFADNRRHRRRRVLGLRLSVPGIPGRDLVTDAIVEPHRDTVLLGCEALESLDLVADHKAGRLLPRPGTEHGITVVVE